MRLENKNKRSGASKNLEYSYLDSSNMAFKTFEIRTNMENAKREIKYALIN